MSRHTLNDGITPDPEIRPEMYDGWCPQLAPLPDLIGAYYNRGMPWELFERQFAEQIASSAVAQGWLRTIVVQARISNVTLLCIEEHPERCHRRLVAEACKNINPLLKVIIE